MSDFLQHLVHHTGAVCGGTFLAGLGLHSVVDVAIGLGIYKLGRVHGKGCHHRKESISPVSTCANADVQVS